FVIPLRITMPTDAESLGLTLRNLLLAAWLLPLVGFVVEIYSIRCWTHRLSKAPAYLAVGCIGTGFLCSLAALFLWGERTDGAAIGGHKSEEHAVHLHEAARERQAAHFAVAAEDPPGANPVQPADLGAIVVEDPEAHEHHAADHPRRQAPGGGSH